MRCCDTDGSSCSGLRRYEYQLETLQAADGFTVTLPEYESSTGLCCV